MSGSFLTASFIAALIPSGALAFVDPPVLVPAHPIAGQVVSISLTSGGCDAYTADPPIITRTANQIRVDLAAAHEIPDFCIFPSGTFTVAVGTFDAGAYTMEVDRTYLSFNGYQTDSIGTIVFSVAEVAAAPAMTVWGSLVLVFLVFAVAAAMQSPPRAPKAPPQPAP